MPDLRAVVVMAYQNVHLTAHELFAVRKHLPRHESLVDPGRFGIQLIAARNRTQRPGMNHAVLVYRGQPSAEHDSKPYARNQAQKAHWERDGRVSVTHPAVEVLLRARLRQQACALGALVDCSGSQPDQIKRWQQARRTCRSCGDGQGTPRADVRTARAGSRRSGTDNSITFRPS